MRAVIKSFSIILLIALVSTGCVVRHGDFSVISNKLIRVSALELDKPGRVKGVTGKDVRHIIVLFPTGGLPTLEGALDDAFEKGGGDVMTDAVIKSWSWYIPYVYGQDGWGVTGDVVKTRRN